MRAVVLMRVIVVLRSSFGLGKIADLLTQETLALGFLFILLQRQHIHQVPAAAACLGTRSVPLSSSWNVSSASGSGTVNSSAAMSESLAQLRHDILEFRVGFSLADEKLLTCFRNLIPILARGLEQLVEFRSACR